MTSLPAAFRQLSNHVPHSLLPQQARPPDIFNALVNVSSNRTARAANAAPEEEVGSVSVSIELGADDHSGSNLQDSSSDGDDSGRPDLETIALISIVQRYLPFALILLVKALFDHGIGLLVCAAMLVTFSHANTQLKREVALQGRRSLGALCFLAGHVAACVCLLYTVFEDQRLYTSLWLSPPMSAPLSLPELLWLVTVTDFVLKLITIVVKAAITALPARIIAFPRRGSVFLSVEASSQLYRACVPLQPWLYYLLGAYNGVYKLAGLFLSVAYIVCKARELFARFKAWRKASAQLLEHSSLGRAPTAAQLASAGSMCTICHEGFTSPVCLPCSHVFCESCLAVWADREPSCPLCRARFGTDPAWRDGATSFFMQLF